VVKASIVSGANEKPFRWLKLRLSEKLNKKNAAVMVFDLQSKRTCNRHRIFQSIWDMTLSASVYGRTRKVVNYT